MVFCQKQIDSLRIDILPMGVMDMTEIFQKALNTKLKTGEVLKISVKKGDYYIKNTVVLSQNNTVLNFEKNTNVYFLTNSSGIIITSNNCIVSNGNFTGNNSTTNDFYKGFGLLLSGASNCVIKNNKFTNISGVGIFLYPRNAVIGCNNNVIRDNVISSPAMNIDQESGSFGILLGYSGKGYEHNNNVITNNILDGNGVLKMGIGIIGHGNNNVISNNSIKNMRHYGIVSYESEDIDTTLNNTKILKNKIENIGENGSVKTVFGMGIYLMKSNNSLVKDNIIINTLKNSNETETLPAGSIAIHLSPSTIVDHNLIDASFMYGIVCSYSNNSTISYNKITDIRKSAIYLISENNIKIINNDISKVGEIVFKGLFESTYLDHIKIMWTTSTYKNQKTGKNISIKNNKINSPNEILYFTGKNSEKEEEKNLIEKNTFENNIINGNQKNIEKLIFYRNDVLEKNYIKNNKVQK